MDRLSLSLQRKEFDFKDLDHRMQEPDEVIVGTSGSDPLAVGALSLSLNPSVLDPELA
jgi:hypothetical protein